MTTYLAKQLFDGYALHNNMQMSVENGHISSIIPAANSSIKPNVHLNGLVCAGFIDTQVNGGGGVLFNYEQTIESLYKILQGHVQFGTTAMLPTLITDSSEKMQKAAHVISNAIVESMPGIVGIHYEGPHLSIAKKGIHSGKQVRPVSDTDLATFTRKDIGKVMVTVAPENVPPDVIRDLVAQGVVVSLGHSGADIDITIAAIDAGARGFTHLFNAMSGLSARDPGLIAAALSDPRVSCGIIADLHHVHPQNCALAYQCIGPERLMLVTDAMAHVGSQMQTLPWLNSTITKVGNKLTLDDGSLAGSCLDMTSALRNMFTLLTRRGHKDLPANVRADVFGDVLNMASRAPANLLNLDGHGQLQVGNRADFVLLDEGIYTKACWIGGKQVFDAQQEEPD
ncbi:MAG: N-acetylglucosamine-6-phosphate deacetylase [Gammaproteobacteria bacterium]|jgi:N-acetylglucosamine-6-phosphate deacetylase